MVMQGCQSEKFGGCNQTESFSGFKDPHKTEHETDDDRLEQRPDHLLVRHDKVPYDLPIILGSGSPRRYELIRRFWPHADIDVKKPVVNEASLIQRLIPRYCLRDVAAELTRAKMEALKADLSLPDECMVLTADTMVIADGRILGKPADAQEAFTMLRTLSGKKHIVVTGLCLETHLHKKKLCLQTVERTEVWFGELDDAMIKWYIQTGEPFDKAGAYGIQGYGAAFIERLSGCYYNVMGLPVFRLMDLLQQTADHFKLDKNLYHILPWN